MKIEPKDMTGLHYHVVPIGDTTEHQMRPTCHCKPTQDTVEKGLWVHHAYDQRDLFEGTQH